MLENLYNKVVGLKAYFEEHLRTTAKLAPALRSCRSQLLCKISVCKNFHKTHRKKLVPQPLFPVHFAEILAALLGDCLVCALC